MPLRAALVTALALVLCAPVSANQEADALVLARVCVHEAGWTSIADCAAIHEVLRNGAERTHMSFASYAHAYSGRALAGRTTRPWVIELHASGAAPHGITSGQWHARRADWLALLEHARSIVAGDEASGCAEPVHDWGSPTHDRERARRLGLVPVDCGDTRNDFYARPSQRGAQREFR